MKKWMFLLVVTLILMLCAIAIADEGAMSLNDALGKLNGGYSGEKILLSDDFSYLALFGEGDYTPSDDGIVILWRDAPLKQFVCYDEELPEDFVGEDMGEPRVYLCTDLMQQVPAARRAHSAEEVKTILMVESYYEASAVISSVIGGSSDMPDEEYLAAVLAGEDVEAPEEEEQQTDFRPVYEGYCIVSLYDAQGHSLLCDYTVTSYSEMRSNPDAALVADAVSDLYALAVVAYLTEDDLTDYLTGATHLPEETIQEMAAIMEDREAFMAYCVNGIWALTETLKELDPEAATYYDEAISAQNLAALLYVMNLRGYAGVDMSDETIRDGLLYIGVPDQQEMADLIGEYVDLFQSIDWQITALF